ncbi:S-layer homology domain-containing protein [Paenibacillus sp. strain BS8-2]
MSKNKRIVYIGLAALLVGACYTASNRVKTADAQTDSVRVIKQYELSNTVDYIEFTIESDSGEFQSSMVLPDGHIVKGHTSTKRARGEELNWSATFVVNTPEVGAYQFEITSASGSYFHLSADVPLFRDIAKHWARADITTFVHEGIVDGYGDGRFGPEDAVTGEAIIKMLVLALTEEQPHGNRQWARLFRWKVLNEDTALEMGLQEYNFAQVVGNDWSKRYLAAADDLGILANWDVADLKKPFARKDVALIITNVMNLVDNKKPAPKLYTDTSALSEEIQNAISKASSFAIFGGYPDGSFQPNKVVSRAESVKILTRLASYLNS